MSAALLVALEPDTSYKHPEQSRAAFQPCLSPHSFCTFRFPKHNNLKISPSDFDRHLSLLSHTILYKNHLNATCIKLLLMCQVTLHLSYLARFTHDHNNKNRSFYGPGTCHTLKEETIYGRYNTGHGTPYMSILGLHV